MENISNTVSIVVLCVTGENLSAQSRK